MRNAATRGLVILGALVAAAAFSQTPLLAVSDAWIRAIPGSDTAAAYMTLRNMTAGPVVITGVESSVAAHAMIHETTEVGGQSRMRPHEQLVVEAGKTIKLAPGGLHVMLHLKQPLAAGQSVPLVLVLSGGGTQHVMVQVRPPSAE